MRPCRGWAALALLIAATAVGDVRFSSGQMHFPYRNRGSYYEGVRSERPISGIDVQVQSISLIPSQSMGTTAPEQTPDSLYLAFHLPDDFDGVDITVQGPNHYYLDRVEADFRPGFNVFRWRSNVVVGLGIPETELEPRVTLVGGMFLPSIIRTTRPTSMPRVESLGVVLVSNVDGSMEYFVRDGDRLILKEQIPISADTPMEIRIPVGSEEHHFDLCTVLLYESGGTQRSLRQFFPIQSMDGE